MLLRSLLAAICCTVALSAAVPAVLVEAESFHQLGGWVVDQQYMDQMGSPFVLAHGLGTPVADASTEASVPTAGTYRVWVRTRDWVARWKAAGAPGRFQLLVDGKPLAAAFGTSGADWHWQDGGAVRISGRKVRLALHDLTGFDGRCDAILLSRDANWTPPEGVPLAAFRKLSLGLPDQPEAAGSFDLVVVGGGMAGITSAVSAARLGLKVALVHDRPVLGGNSSSEIRVWPGGRTLLGPNPGLGALEHELDPGAGAELRVVDGSRNARPDAGFYADEKKLYVVQAEKNLRLFLNTHAVQVEKSGNRIAAVIARDVRTGRGLRFAAPLFADCTGDATLGFLAGADFRVGRESRAETGEPLAPEQADRQVMGTSFMWYAEAGAAPAAFPETPWALEFNERTAQRTTKGDWDWEVGMQQDQIADGESIRDHAYRAIYGNWSFLKNHAENRAAYERQRLSWLAFVAGKRESRRLLGDVLLKETDMTGNVAYPDASAATTWSIDLHYPKPENSQSFPGAEFRSIAKFQKQPPYAIPYRCFYSRNVENLFMAGRNISVTHAALGAVRVQRTTAMMGEVVGMAASLAHRYATTPRGVYQSRLDDLKKLMQAGVGKEDNVNQAAQVAYGFSTAQGGAVAYWKPPVGSIAPVRIRFHAVPDPQGGRAATIEILHNGYKAVRRFDMTEGEDRWLDLGTFAFTGNGTDCVRIVRSAPGRAFQAGDVKFEVLRADGETIRTTVIVNPSH
jgi:hypothetical protein